MRTLVTGGAGFIGGHLSEQLLRDGHSVTVLDSLHPYYSHRIKEHTLDKHRVIADAEGSEYEFVEGDVRNESLMRTLVSQADVVFHQAARAGVRDSAAAPRVYDEVNVGGTLNLLDAARETDLERVVVASSSSVYGGRGECVPFDETDPTLPVSHYGVSKLAAERYAAVYHEAYGIPTVSLRYFTVYGPRMRPNMAISNFVSRCMNGDPPVVYGDGTQTRDFTYVDDVVDANLRLLESSEADGEVLNIGSTDNIEIRTLARAVRDQLAPAVPLEYAERYEADAEHTHADVSKANELITYSPNYTIREGIEKFIEWYRANQEWYGPLVRES